MPGDFDNLFGDGPDLMPVSGALEVLPGGWGVLRRGVFEVGGGAVYVSSSQVQDLRLKTGDQLRGQARPPKETEKHPVLVRLASVNRVSVRQ